MGIVNTDLKNLKAYKVVEGLDLTVQDLFEKYLANDSSAISRLSILSKGQYAGTSLPSLTSKPSSDHDDWHPVYHPIFGACFEFRSSKNIVDYVGKAGVEFAKVNVNFDAAYPKATTDGIQIYSTPDEHQVYAGMNPEEDYENEPETKSDKNQTATDPFESMVLLVFEAGSFLSSQSLGVLDRESKKYFTVEQEIIDKTNTKDVFDCTDDEDYVEDSCLEQCLVTRHVREMKCLHARIQPWANASIKESYQACVLDDLYQRTQDHDAMVREQKARHGIALPSRR